LTEIALWALVGIGFAAGLVGSTLGIGGGVFIVPMLTVLAHLPIHVAIASSLVSIVATSTTAAAAYVKNRFANIRVGILLEAATLVGAIGCAFLAVYLSSQVLAILFAVLLFYVGYRMLFPQPAVQGEELSQQDARGPDSANSTTGLHGSFYDPALKEVVSYRVRRLPQGLGAGLLAGGLSGLLGIGGGVIQVPAMNRLMQMPIKAAIGTSSFIMGITALGGSLVYCLNGYVYPVIVAPVAVGAFLGAQLGSRLAPRAKGIVLARTFAVIVFVIAAIMIATGVTGGL
jgi:uncharacterized membrane protein YfcA